MAIYQAPRKRWRLALVSGVIGALGGLGVGLAIGGGDADTATALGALDAKLEDAAAPLDVLVIHGQADTGSSTDPRVVTDAVARTEQRFDEIRDDVRMIDPDAVAAFDRHVERLRQYAHDDAEPDEIADEADALADLLRGIVRT